MKTNNIRQYFDEKTQITYYSIVDIIEELGLSSDSRNYWKVLKNRLKNTNPQLVTNCNQVKMPARDGKIYLTDGGDSETILKIIQIISPKKVPQFSDFFEKNRQTLNSKQNISDFEQNELSTQYFENEEENEISIDACIKNNFIYVCAFIAGIDPDDIFLSATSQNILIKGKRFTNKNHADYDIEELFWGKFMRNIPLPKEIDIDQIEANFLHGLVTIKMPIIDKTRTKIIRIKNI